MAKQIEGVYERIIDCAKAEFLKKGFQEASLRTIAQAANTSTGSIYTRFTDKEGLFHAIVSPVTDELKEWFWSEQEKFSSLSDHNQTKQVLCYGDESYKRVVNYIYDNVDVFQLLHQCSDGTKYANFINDIVEMDVEYTIRFIESIGNDVLESGRASPELFHILSSAFYTGVFETIAHKMDRQQAMAYVAQLRRFFQYGWKDLFFPQQVRIENERGYIDEEGWIHCPICKNKTRIKVRKDTVITNFPLYCPKCREETLITVSQLNINVIEPDARRRASN